MAQKEPIRNFVLHDRHGHDIDFSSFSVVSDVSVTFHAGVGEPSCESRYQGGTLYLDFYNIKGEGITGITYDESQEDGGTNYIHITTDGGDECTFPVKNGSRGNGITSIDTVESQEDDGYNVVRIHCTDDKSEDGTVLRIKNGKRGNGIASVTEELSNQDGGINTHTIHYTDPNVPDNVIHTRNGQTGQIGPQGATGIYQEGVSNPVAILDTILGNSDTSGMTQKAITDNLLELMPVWLRMEPDINQKNDSSSWKFGWSNPSLNAGNVVYVESKEDLTIELQVRRGQNYVSVGESGASSITYEVLPTDGFHNNGANVSVLVIVSGTDYISRLDTIVVYATRMESKEGNLASRVGQHDKDIEVSNNNIAYYAEGLNSDFGSDLIIDTSVFEPSPCAIGNNKFGMASGANSSHIAVPVDMGDTFVLTNNSATNLFVTWATSDYNPPYANNDAIPVPSWIEQRYVILPQDSIMLSAPYGSEYLLITLSDYGGNDTSDFVLVRKDCKKSVKFTDFYLGELPKETIDTIVWPVVSSFRVYPYTIVPASQNKGRSMPFGEYAGKLARIQPRVGQTLCRFAFLSAPITSSLTQVQFCEGEILRDGEWLGVVPPDCAYLYVYAIESGVDVAPIVTVYGSVEQLSFAPSETINTAMSDESECELSTTWRKTSNGAESHIAIPCSAGDVFRITANMKASKAAFLTSEYNPPYNNGDTIPLASSLYSISSGSELVIEAPSSAAYLALSTTSTSWRVEKGELSNLPSAPSIPVKIRVAGWNIGKFSLGTQPYSTITNEQFLEKSMAYKNVINKINADIIMVSEFNENIVEQEGSLPPIKAYNAIFNLYPYAIEGGTQSAYMQLADFSTFKSESAPMEVYYAHSMQARYYLVHNAVIKGHDVKFVVTHLDWDQGDHGAEYRAEQIQKLITDFKDVPYCVIVGDFNVSSVDEFDAFAEAGFSMANHAYLGDIATYYSDETPKFLDNIICKGFSINNIQLFDENRTLSDHAILSADLTLNE